MKVPPRRAAAVSTIQMPPPSTLSSTPKASTRQAAAKARSLPQRCPAQPQNATEGAAARPTKNQARFSAGCSTGSARTMSEMKVAVMT